MILHGFNTETPDVRGEGDWPSFVRFSGHGELAAILCRMSEAVVGCVAWLTCPDVLAELAKVRDGCSIVVHHDPEVFARADVRAAYSACRHYDRLGLNPDDEAFASVRPECQANARSMMHHKFLVGIKGGEPFAVWCGSANLTRNATRGMDHSMLLSDPGIVLAFYSEYLSACIHSDGIEWP